ncbi:hypothetical protein IWZ01DRAFT_61717 [Phyllosticta capitalensis]
MVGRESSSPFSTTSATSSLELPSASSQLRFSVSIIITPASLTCKKHSSRTQESIPSREFTTLKISRNDQDLSQHQLKPTPQQTPTMCKSHKVLHLCGCFLRHPDIEFCAAALARLNCAVEDVIDLSWCFCPDYPNCEVVIGGDTEHYRSQARLPAVPAVGGGGGGHGRESRMRSARVRFREGPPAASAARGAGHRGPDTDAGLENGIDPELARQEESEEE